MKYRVIRKKDGWYVQRGLFVYFNKIGPFPTEGDARTWINMNVGFNTNR